MSITGSMKLYGPLLALGLGACAHNPALVARSVRHERAESIRDHEVKEAALARSCAVKRAELKGELKEQLAEERGRLEVAQDQFVVDRRQFAAHARERLRIIDARAEELGTKASFASTDARHDVRDDWSNFRERRARIDARIKGLASEPAASWAATRNDVGRQLSALESGLDKITLKLWWAML